MEALGGVSIGEIKYTWQPFLEQENNLDPLPYKDSGLVARQNHMCSLLRRLEMDDGHDQQPITR